MPNVIISLLLLLCPRMDRALASSATKPPPAPYANITLCHHICNYKLFSIFTLLPCPPLTTSRVEVGCLPRIRTIYHHLSHALSYLRTLTYGYNSSISGRQIVLAILFTSSSPLISSYQSNERLEGSFFLAAV